MAKENAAVDIIEQVGHRVDRSQRKDLLTKILKEDNNSQALIFTRTKHAANRLAMLLNKENLRDGSNS